MITLNQPMPGHLSLLSYPYSWQSQICLISQLAKRVQTRNFYGGSPSRLQNLREDCDGFAAICRSLAISSPPGLFV